ncbi:hypothetical protein C8R46DRAFT_461311 [Mycena filopes]|nr:hypothetical protein C8R46DRAFT_461311 [Mycena filopes]
MESKPTKPPTCGRCRTKKIRCDGQHPCGPCSRARTDTQCVYTAPTVSHVPELRKGAACSACRRKKKKCSGDWPCRTCIISKKEDDCKYDDGSQLSFTRALIERTLELEQLLSAAIPPSTTFSVGTELSTGLDVLLSSNPAVVPEPFNHHSSHENMARSSMAALLRDDDPRFNCLETGFNSTVQLPSGLDPPVVESSEEKMLRIRKLFLARGFQFGLALAPQKLAALAAGDLSGAVVHPVLVHVSQLWGYMLDYCERNHTWAYLPDDSGDEAEQMRLILGALAGLIGPPLDPVTAVITYLSISLYFYHQNDFRRGQEFLGVANDTILKHDLDLAVLTVPVVEDEAAYSILPLNSANELRSAFSHVIYAALDAQLVLGVPLTIEPRFLDKFDLLMKTKVVNNADLAFTKAKSIRMLTQTRRLTATWDGHGQGQSPGAVWFENYWKLIEQLNLHVASLNHANLRVSFIPDARTAELTLKLCLIITTTALADLHGIFAPSHVESSRRYRDNVVEIVSISSTFTIDDCQYLDPILPFCWSIATKRILDNQVVYENQESIITAIRACNHNLQQMLPLVPDFERINPIL